MTEEERTNRQPIIRTLNTNNNNYTKLCEEIEDKIRYQIINREEDDMPKKYSWKDIQYAIKLTIEELKTTNKKGEENEQ